jgi:hypothetical protein
LGGASNQQALAIILILFGYPIIKQKRTEEVAVRFKEQRRRQ